MTATAIRAALSAAECQNAVMAHMAGNPEWCWAIEVKHLLAGQMNGHQFYDAINALVESGRIERQLVPIRGWRVRISHCHKGA